MTALIALLTFSATFFGIFAINLAFVDLFQRDRKEMLRRVEKEMRQQQRIRARDSIEAGDDKSKDNSFDSILGESQVQHRTVWEWLKDLTEQSGMRISTQRVLGISTSVALVLALVLFAAFNNPIISGFGAGIGFMLPIAYVSMKRRKRLEQLRSQLPDVLELMSRVLRAGQTITQAISSVSKEFKRPAAEEFGYCYEQQNLGLAPEIALRGLAQCTGLLEVKIFVLAVLVHRQTGGNLTEILDKLAHIVRERFRINGEIKTLTAEGRMQAVILLGLPFLVWLGLFLINSTYALKLFDHPTLIITMLVMMTLGSVWIHRIVNFDF